MPPLLGPIENMMAAGYISQNRKPLACLSVINICSILLEWHKVLNSCHDEVTREFQPNLSGKAK